MQQIARSVALAFNNLPRPHRVMLGSLTVLTLTVAVWRPYVYHPESTPTPIVKTIELEKKEIRSLLPEASEPIDQSMPDEVEDIPQDELDDKTAGEEGVHEYVVSTGDTLSSILNQYGIDMGDISQLAAADKDLRNMKIGQQISWTLTADGDLQRMTWEVSRRETRTYDRVDGGFKMTSAIQEGDWVNSVLKGTVGGSFVSSAKEAGLTNVEISAVIKAMQWQMDFRKLKKGDEFSVLMSREMLEGKQEQSQLLGVRLRSDGKDYFAIRADDGKFYDRNGTGLAKGFMRFPTSKQFRVSSNFNPRRLNPVTGRVAPHKGVDFAMPQGTPVLSVGDGEVVVAKRSGAAGYYVAVRHGRTYTTRYMHLRKLLVKEGQKVKRGDRIALSGNTGRSTGPHLHYEVWINQQAVNPLTAKLPRTEGLSGTDRRDYLAQVKDIVPQLKFD
ncbi:MULTISPECIES: murein DD-endopeptidase MepM [Enterobacteriaceae]|uniref:Murein DD-endopeptidase MepM n=2 Tax=Enterobacteriaceae TaxID=543 RepID=A0ABW1Q2V7_9ENTR|nr:MULTISPECIES: murein DD-endopeptidase MepM [Phytobacter]AUU90430.1 murein DD-endopeptidase MepM [Enterobacteriaceae bacterium ENNIH3]AUV09484.1 murein DD-endopeptidase MepM [Enterobacteriaceae bacterium ENNIH2]MBS6738683.1 murein DD-endopeptidase MepM [Enterobacteriaceae bacterium]PTA96386.1 murein DD-endopeptidase MepM [Kluyvera sp. Nf5]PWF51115.1 murein DD-endopeptidase MepM [[Kluyvera] intestini]PXW60778.1 murein DD-endopeptidase [Grimontella sp. AG753]QIH64109.1 murein DD-endopeptidas